MAINLPILISSKLKPVAGIKLGVTKAGIHKQNKKDLLVIKLALTATIAGVFTRNCFRAAPIQICQENLFRVNHANPIRALLINTGNANAGTGKEGLAHAYATCETLATLLKCMPTQILPFSTGVILERFPVERIQAALANAVANLSVDNWLNAAETIMTTDTQPKAVSQTLIINNTLVTMTGISKGAGMIKPNMATMLGFLAFDVVMPQNLLKQLAKDAAEQSFNCITIDGDTSTNDAFMLIATGASKLNINKADSIEYKILADAVFTLSQDLAHQIVRDGEGATKFITIIVEQGKSLEECRQIAYSISHSPLVKTAFFASDPNLGRILAAIGHAGITDLDILKLDFYINDLCVVKNGERHPNYQEIEAQYIMNKSEIKVRIKLARGSATATIWTCDLSYNYIKINTAYRS